MTLKKDVYMFVPKEGLEPSHSCEYMHLKHACIPVSPLRRGFGREEEAISTTLYHNI